MKEIIFTGNGKITENKSSLNLHSVDTVILYPGEVTKVYTGLEIKDIKKSFMILSKSSLAKNSIMMMNAPVLLEEGDSGQIYIYLINLGPNKYTIEKDTPIAKLIGLNN